MLSKKMVDALNEQVNKELYSAYFYIGMSSYAADIGLDGVSNWFYVQMKEEMAHAEKIYKFIIQKGAKSFLKSIEEPPQKFSSVVDLFDKTLEHEKKVTAMINNLVKIAREEQDNATEIFLQWFVSEQVEEESNADMYLKKFKLVGNDGSGLFILDKELATRVFTPISAVAK